MKMSRLAGYGDLTPTQSVAATLRRFSGVIPTIAYNRLSMSGFA
jgi:hypothetical protein